MHYSTELKGPRDLYDHDTVPDGYTSLADREDLAPVIEERSEWFPEVNPPSVDYEQ